MIKQLRKYLNEHYGIFFHSQNLNGKWYEHSRKEVLGPMWRHGRAWMHVHPEYLNEDKRNAHHPMRKPAWYTGNVCFSWSIPGRHPGIGVTVGNPSDEDNLSMHLGILLFDVWLTFEGMGWQVVSKALIPDPKDYEGRETDLRFFAKGVWWNVWHTDGSWSNKTPRWRSGSWYPLDSFFGRLERSQEVLDHVVNVPVPLPEGTYHADVELTRNRWTRKRWPHWPFGLVVDGAEVRMHEGQELPIPGKGENSYDCGDDATFTMYMPNIHTVEEAIGHAVADTLRTRQKRNGDYGWHTPPSGLPVQSILAPKEDA